jgi:multidrug resistance efflux pump
LQGPIEPPKLKGWLPQTEPTAIRSAPSAEDATDQPGSDSDPTPRRSSRANALIIGLGSGLLLIALGVVMHVLTTRARDAVVDADVIELSSPISGQLVELKVEEGEAVDNAERLALVQNPRASDGEVRQLRTALTMAEATLEQVEQQLTMQRKLATDFGRDAGDQRRLETARTNNELDQLRADRARERQELAFSERDLRRQEELQRAGAIAELVVDRARTAVAKNREQLQAIEARIRAQLNRVQASERNLNLDRTRGDTDPLPRLQDLRLRLSQLTGERAAARRRVKGLQAQLATAERVYEKQQQAWIDAPLPAVVWRLQARKGDSLRPQQPLLQLVNCANRWVTTDVSQGDLTRLRISSRARIDLIRSGMGRLPGNDDTATPLRSTSPATARCGSGSTETCRHQRANSVSWAIPPG